MRANLDNVRITDPLIARGLKLGVKIWTPITAELLTASDPPVLIMSPAGAINLLLPASNDTNKGLTFFLVNNSASAVTMQSSGGAGFTTAIVLAANESTIVVCTGHATAALGWQGVGTASSA